MGAVFSAMPAHPADGDVRRHKRSPDGGAPAVPAGRMSHSSFRPAGERDTEKGYDSATDGERDDDGVGELEYDGVSVADGVIDGDEPCDIVAVGEGVGLPLRDAVVDTVGVDDGSCDTDSGTTRDTNA